MLIFLPLLIIIITIILIAYSIFGFKENNEIDFDELYELYSSELSRTNKEIEKQNKTIAKLEKEIRKEKKITDK